MGIPGYNNLIVQTMLAKVFSLTSKGVQELGVLE